MEKCINHPYATTDQHGFCWKCEEEFLRAIAGKLRDKDVLFPRLVEQAKETIKKYGLPEDMNIITSPHLIQGPEDTITREVMKDLAKRADKGLQKYNTTLGDNNHQNMLQHAYEEALDMAQYLKKEITTLNTVQDLVREYPNDMQLGAKIREEYARR